MTRAKKVLCLSGVGIVGILLTASIVYACCGMDPVITDDPIEEACVGQEVTISGTVSATAEWGPYYYTTDLAMTIVVQPPSGDPVPLDVTLTLTLDEYPNASFDFEATYTPTETGTYTYVKTASWTTDYSTMTRSASGTFDVILCEGKVTGGGWFVSPDVAKPKPKDRDTFGFVAQYQQNSSTPMGNLEFQVHGGSPNVHSTTITGLFVIGNTATFTGTCSVDGAPGFTFTVTVVDNGEPGMNNDTFAITVPGVLAIPPQILDGGNIQVHK